MELNFKPNVTKIIVESLIYLTIFILLPTIIISSVLFLAKSSLAMLILIIGLILYIFLLITSIGSAKNTDFHIDDKYILRKTLFISEIQEDVPIAQITNVDYTISWFWDKIFKTGTIKIYTSGTASADLALTNINNTLDIYNNINNLLESSKNTKSVTNNTKINNSNATNENKLIKTITPNAKIATISYVLTKAMSFIFIFIYLGVQLISDTASIKYLIIIIIIISIFSLIPVLFIYKAYKKKQYNFYTNKLEYYDGFFTLHKASVPLERITNITEIRTLFDRIFGVSKISIETAGSSGAEISINYVKNGEDIVANLKEVLKKNGRN